MSAHTPFNTPSDLRYVLSQDHARLDHLFDEVLEAFSANQRDEANEIWTRFEQGLRRHIQFEEQHLLPRFKLTFPDEAAALEREHLQLLSQLDQLSLGVDQHLARADMVTQFVGALRAHAARESRLLYTWAQSADGDGWWVRVQSALHDLVSAARTGE